MGFIRQFFSGKIAHPSGHGAAYKSGPNFADPGAAGFVFQPETTNPVYTFRGRGRLAGALSVFAGRQAFAPIAIPHAGIPTQAGTIVLQGLSQADAVASAYAAMSQAPTESN